MDNIDKMVGIRIKTRRKELNLTQKMFMLLLEYLMATLAK